MIVSICSPVKFVPVKSMYDIFWLLKSDLSGWRAQRTMGTVNMTQIALFSWQHSANNTEVRERTWKGNIKFFWNVWHLCYLSRLRLKINIFKFTNSYYYFLWNFFWNKSWYKCYKLRSMGVFCQHLNSQASFIVLLKIHMRRSISFSARWNSWLKHRQFFFTVETHRKAVDPCAITYHI